jgi:hypothetical protein
LRTNIRAVGAQVACAFDVVGFGEFPAWCLLVVHYALTLKSQAILDLSQGRGSRTAMAALKAKR